MKDTAKAIWNYIKSHDGEDFTAQDIADATGIGIKSVNGTVTAAFQRFRDEEKNPCPLTFREEAVIETEDGSKKTVKFIRLTDAGRDKEFDD